jgi:hypothetical protein
MKTKLTITAMALLVAANAARAGDVQATYNSRCDWVMGGVYGCHSKTETATTETRTFCASGGIDAACTSKTILKDPPPLPPSRTTDYRTGVVIMRGGAGR